MEMGGFPQAFFSRVVASLSTPADRVCSHCPSNRLIFHTRACFLASYLALPAPALPQLHSAQISNESYQFILSCCGALSHSWILQHINAILSLPLLLCRGKWKPSEWKLCSNQRASPSFPPDGDVNAHLGWGGYQRGRCCRAWV